jgi:hypothetical protein
VFYRASRITITSEIAERNIAKLRISGWNSPFFAVGRRNGTVFKGTVYAKSTQ